MSSSDSEEEVSVPVRRKRKTPPWLDEYQNSSSAPLDIKVVVKCNQSGRTFTVKTEKLSSEDGKAIEEGDLIEGCQLLLDYDKKSYPVTVIRICRKNEDLTVKKKKKKAEDISSVSIIQQAKEVYRQTIHAELSSASPSTETQPSIEISPSTATKLSISAEDIMKVLLEVKEGMDKVVKFLQKPIEDVKKEENGDYVVDGINLLHMPARDMTAYGRCLLDVLFTKEEQRSSVVLKTKKSSKPPLSPRRVQKLFDCVQQKYPNYDHKALMASLGQKCRDRSREVKPCEQSPCEQSP